MEIGLALAGGGIRGAVHIGVIKAIQEENIKINYISGTSSGSIVAAMYAMGYNCEEILEFLKKYCKKIKYVEFKTILKLIYGGVFKNKLIIDGLNSGEIIEKLMGEIAKNKGIYNINQIKMPLYIPTVDIKSGEILYFGSKQNIKKLENNEKYLNQGNIGRIVRASCSYPVIFSPCKYKNTQLIDGGIRENLPWKILKKNNVENIIGVCFDKNINEKCCLNIIDVINNSLDILIDELNIYEREGINKLINIKTENIGLLDMKEINYLYNLGYKEGKKQIKKINKKR